MGSGFGVDKTAGLSGLRAAGPAAVDARAGAAEGPSRVVESPAERLSMLRPEQDQTAAASAGCCFSRGGSATHYGRSSTLGVAPFSHRSGAVTGAW